MANDASERARGVANRGVESNVRKGEVHTIVPGKTYNVVGFDIGKADLKKPGFEKELDPVVKQLQTERKEFNDGKRATHPVVTVTGHASESVRPGKGPQAYASARADAVKQYLIARDIPPDWIQTTTSRESPKSRRVNVSGSPERKALARSATIEVGESENVARAAHRRSLENRYADPPEYLTSQEYKRLPRRDMARPVDMSRTPDMLPAPLKWQWPAPPPVTQNSEVSCWAAVLSSWLGAVRSPKWEPQNDLIEHEQAFVGVSIAQFRRVADEHEMRVSPIRKRSDFTADRIKERLAISPLIIGYNQSSEEEEWWHDVVVYGARTDSSGKTSYAIMDPGPRGEVVNLAQAQSLAGSDRAKLIEVDERYFFPKHGNGDWVIGWSKKPLKR